MVKHLSAREDVENKSDRQAVHLVAASYELASDVDRLHVRCLQTSHNGSIVLTSGIILGCDSGI